MMRDMDLIRLLLLEIEARSGGATSQIIDLRIDGYSREQVGHHVWLLEDGGFIICVEGEVVDEAELYPRCLTWKGHEFLDAVRDPDVWRQSASLAQRGRNQSLRTVWKIAQKLAEHRTERLATLN